MDILDEVNTHIPERERGITMEPINVEFTTVDEMRGEVDLTPIYDERVIEDLMSLIDAPISRRQIELSNMTEDDDGNLVHAPWVGNDIGDMTVDQLQEHLESTVGESVDVASAIASMKDPITPVIGDLMTQMVNQSGKTPKHVNNKKRKSKKNMAKASRKRNRK